MSKPRVAILSATGTARKRTLPAIAEAGLAEVVGLHARDAGKLAALAADYGVPVSSTDAAALLERTRPDFVYVASPPTLHREQLQLVLERGLPALCEKPLCLTADEAGLISRLAEQAGVPVRVAHHLRHQPGVARLKALIGGGELGPLRRGSFQWSFWLNEESTNARWKLRPELGGPNAFYDAGVHAVDLLLHLLPAPTAVTALGVQARFEGIVDTIDALAACGGATVALSASLAARYPRNDLTLDFEAGTIFVPHALGEQPFPRLELTTAGGTTVEAFSPVNPYAEEIADFIRLLRGGPSVGTTPREAWQALGVLEAIELAERTGRRVDVRA